MVFLKRQVEQKNGEEYVNYYFYHGNQFLGTADDGIDQIQANIEDKLEGDYDLEKIHDLQEEAKEKLEEKRSEEDYNPESELSDHKMWERREDLEGVGQKWVWENTEDNEITVEVEFDGEFYDVLEKDGGFTEYEVATGLESEAEALRIANNHMEDIADKQENGLSDVEAKAPEIGDEFYHVRMRNPSDFHVFRVPDWAENTAQTVSEGAKVKMGRKHGDSIWKVQSVMIEKDNVDRDKAKELAERITEKIESSNLSDSGEVDSEIGNWVKLTDDAYDLWEYRVEDVDEKFPNGRPLVMTVREDEGWTSKFNYKNDKDREVSKELGTFEDRDDARSVAKEFIEKNKVLNKDLRTALNKAEEIKEDEVGNNRVSDNWIRKSGWEDDRFPFIWENKETGETVWVRSQGAGKFDVTLGHPDDGGIVTEFIQKEPVRSKEEAKEIAEDWMGDNPKPEKFDDNRFEDSEDSERIYPVVDMVNGRVNKVKVFDSKRKAKEFEKSLDDKGLGLEAITYNLEDPGEEPFYLMIKVVSGGVRKVDAFSDEEEAREFWSNHHEGSKDVDVYSFKLEKGEGKTLPEDMELSDVESDEQDFLFEGDDFRDQLANSDLVYNDWDDDSVANIDDRNPLEAGDPESERVNEEILLSQELKNVEELSEDHREVAESLTGELEVHKARVKQPESILKKLREKYSEEVTDIIGVTVYAEDKEEVMEIADDLKDRHGLYPIGEEDADENHYEDDGFYRAYHLILEFEHDGEVYPAEVQIKTREQAKLHSLAHEYYKRNEPMPDLLEEKARELESGEISSVDKSELKEQLP